MAEVTGPISTLPGASRKPPEGVMCDDHPTVMAVSRIQGETDSFGSEQHDLCQACVDRWRAYRDSPKAEVDRTGVCDWCSSRAPLRPRRDYEEGMSGRVYQVCDACVRKENDRLAEELKDSDRYDDGWYDDDSYSDDFQEESQPPAWSERAYGLRFKGTDVLVQSRRGDWPAIFRGNHTVLKFMERHKGKLRGHSIEIVCF